MLYFWGIKACLINFYAPDKLRISAAATITWITQHDMIRITITLIQHDHISTSTMLSPFQNTSHPTILGQIIWKGKWPCLYLFITHIWQQLIFIFTCTLFKRVKWHVLWIKFWIPEFWILKWLVFLDRGSICLSSTYMHSSKLHMHVCNYAVNRW